LRGIRGGDKFVGTSAGVEDEVPRVIYTIVSFELERVEEEQMARKQRKWSPGRGTGKTPLSL